MGSLAVSSQSTYKFPVNFNSLNKEEKRKKLFQKKDKRKQDRPEDFWKVHLRRHHSTLNLGSSFDECVNPNVLYSTREFGQFSSLENLSSRVYKERKENTYYEQSNYKDKKRGGKMCTDSVNEVKIKPRRNAETAMQEHKVGESLEKARAIAYGTEPKPFRNKPTRKSSLRKTERSKSLRHSIKRPINTYQEKYHREKCKVPKKTLKSFWQSGSKSSVKQFFTEKVKSSRELTKKHSTKRALKSIFRMPSLEKAKYYETTRSISEIECLPGFLELQSSMRETILTGHICKDSHKLQK